MTARPRSAEARYAALAAVLPVLLVLPALVQPARLVYPSWSDLADLTLIHWPKVTLLRQSLAGGQGWPLWSPYALSGQPLAANQLAMLFYPPALLLLPGPRGWAFSLFYALHLAWAGLGAHRLVRELGRPPAAALLAAVIFALGGKMAAHLAIGHVSLMAAMAWTPWAFAWLHRALTRRSAAFAALTGLALAAQATTHTYALAYTAYGLLLYAALHLLTAPGAPRERLRAAWSLLPRLALIPLTAVLLGAAQLLPLLEMAPHSNRALNFAEATFFSLSPGQTLTGILFPTPNVGHEWTIYPGLLTLLLAAGAWQVRRERPVRIFGALTLLGVVLALGSSTPVYRLAYDLLPGLRWLRTPARLWFFISLGLAVLAAYGLEGWQVLWRRPARRWLRLALVAWIAFALLLSLGVTLGLDQAGRGTWGLGLFGLLSGVLLLSASSRRGQHASRFPRYWQLAACGLILVDLLSFDVTLLRFPTQAQVAAQGREAAQWLAARPGPFRAYSPSFSLPQPAATEAGLQQIDGVEPVHLADYDRFLALAGGYEQDAFAVTIPPFPEGVPLAEAHRGDRPNLHLLGLLNGQYLVAAFPLDLPGLIARWQNGATWIFENELALPRAWVVHRTAAVDHEQVWGRLPTLDPARLALVEGGPPLSGPAEPSPARVVEQSANRLVVETELASPGFLVLSEIWYPGWQARDNGQETPIRRTDAVLRGVYLEAGSHTVEFCYSPWSVRAGLGVSGLTALVLLLWAAWLWRSP